jgi:hypothetical protein
LFALCWLSPALVAQQRVFELPVLIQREINAHPQWPLSRTAFNQASALLLFAPLALFLTTQYRKQQPHLLNLIAAAIAILTILWTVNPFLNSDAGWTSITGRLGGLSYMQLGILAPAVMWLLISLFSSQPLYALVLAPLLVLPLRAPVPRGLNDEFIQRRAILVQSLSHLQVQWPNDAIIVAAHGDQFVITATIGVAARQNLPAEQHWATYWMLDNLDPKYLTPETIRLSPATVIMDTVNVRRVLQSMPATDQGKLLNENFHLQETYRLISQ